MALVLGATCAAGPHPGGASDPQPAEFVETDWAHLLGPRGDMTTPERPLLSAAPADGPRLLWEAPKGEGFASPAVAEGRVALAHRIGDEAILDCLDAANGRRIWRHSRPTAYVDRYGYNGGPRCGPVIAGGRVFALGADGVLDAVALTDGRRLWTLDLPALFGTRQNFFGAGATPLVEGGRVIVNVGAPGPCLAAFEASSGRLAWKAGEGWSGGYAAPIAATIHGRRRILCFTGGESDPPDGGLLVADADAGRETWRFPWRGRRHESVNAAPPLAAGDMVVISECYGRGTVALRLDADGRGVPVWTNRSLGVHFMRPLVRDGCLYAIDGHGPGDTALVCLDLDTGRERWRDPMRWTEAAPTPEGAREIAAGVRLGWLLATDSAVLCLGELGHLLWLEVSSAGVDVRSRVRLFLAPQTWSAPAVSGGRLYVCQNTSDVLSGAAPRLRCYDLRGAGR